MGKYLDEEGCRETLKTAVRGSPCRGAEVIFAVLLSMTIERKLKWVLLETSLVKSKHLPCNGLRFDP